MSGRTHSNIFPEERAPDFKAEVAAAEMIENGIDADRILIMMLGAAKRTFRKDVHEVSEEVSHYDQKQYTIIKTHKEGIYDMLPEGLFHSPTMPKSAVDEKEIIKEIKRNHELEANARKFFQPYEVAINQLRIQMALYENRLDKRLHNNDLVNIFARQWDIFKYLDARQANIFIHLIPLIHDTRDDYPVASIIFELIFLVPVSITLRKQQPVPLNKDELLPGEQVFLGVNFTTGNKTLFTGDDEISIVIGPMKNHQLAGFMDNGTSGKVLEMLCDYLLPAHLDTSIAYELEDSDKSMRLADKSNDYNATVGLSTYL